MAYYRLQHFRNGTRSFQEEFEASDDVQAVRTAEALAGERSAELWSGTRLVNGPDAAQHRRPESERRYPAGCEPCTQPLGGGVGKPQVRDPPIRHRLLTGHKACALQYPDPSQRRGRSYSGRRA